MVRFLTMGTLLLASRMGATAFMTTTRNVVSKSAPLFASDSDFDDFSSKVAFMFPGQGAQFVGMCGELCKEWVKIVS